MKEKLDILLQEGKAKILAAKTEAELQEIKASLLGKKGSVTELMKELPKLAAESRREMGQAVNKAKNELTALVEAHREAIQLKSAEIPADFDCTVPGILPPGGALHPITQM